MSKKVHFYCFDLFFSVVLIEQIAKLTDFVCLSEMSVLLNERHTR